MTVLWYTGELIFSSGTSKHTGATSYSCRLIFFSCFSSNTFNITLKALYLSLPCPLVKPVVRHLSSLAVFNLGATRVSFESTEVTYTLSHPMAG